MARIGFDFMGEFGIVKGLFKPHTRLSLSTRRFHDQCVKLLAAAGTPVVGLTMAHGYPPCKVFFPAVMQQVFVRVGTLSVLRLFVIVQITPSAIHLRRTALTRITPHLGTSFLNTVFTSSS